MIITISGMLGSGKSTIAKLLAKKLDYKHCSTGDLMRKMASERSISLMELSKIAEIDAQIDKDLDDAQIKLGKNMDDLVLDARLGFYFIPKSFKIFLKCDKKIAAERVFSAFRNKESGRNNEGLSGNTEDIFNSLKKRRHSEQKRWSSMYGINYEDESYYDLVINTSNKTPEDIIDIIMEKIKLLKK